jgi:ribosomal-protein-alanine N-acetyltransferase
MTESGRAGDKAWTLREYRKDDVDAMYALDIACFEPVFRFSRGAMRRFAEAAGAVTVLAESAGKLAGFCIAEVEEHIGYIVTLDVVPEWRRKGLARALMAEVEARVQAAGAGIVTLHVFTGNVAAIRFYEAMGYERAGSARGFYGRDMDGWVYRKRLGYS